MQVTCSRCSTEYDIDDKFGGRWGHCEECDRYIMLPIPDTEQLFAWLRSAPWKDVEEFITNYGLRGHTPRTVKKVNQIFEQLRWDEEYRIRREQPASNNSRLFSVRERTWRRTERNQWRQHTLEELRKMSPSEFEERVADVFAAQGYLAIAVGGTQDNGVDVEIKNPEGDLIAVAQCKRYADGNRITSRDIRAFAGAFMLSKAKKGFYITTGELTRQARLTAARLLWLKVYSGRATAKYIEKHLGRIDVNGNAPMDTQGVNLEEANHPLKPT